MRQITAILPGNRLMNSLSTKTFLLCFLAGWGMESGVSAQNNPLLQSDRAPEIRQDPRGQADSRMIQVASTRQDNSGVAITVYRSAAQNRSAQVVIQGLSQDQVNRLVRAKLDTQGWLRLFRICVAADGGTNQPAMLGTYRVKDGRLLFEPRFPFEPGLKYRATFDPAALSHIAALGGEAVSLEFSLPEPPAGPPTIVTHIYPSGNVLPENQLKFYIHFSASMSRGEAYQRIHLLNAAGQEVDYPFLKLDEELWDGTATRFTLFFDPGRIKRGLKPRELFGPVLEEGKSYTLVIDRDWLDARGKPLKETVRKSFRVTAPDETQPDPKQWKLIAPTANTRTPLAVTFREPLDHAMLQRVLIVKNSADKTIEGSITVEAEETRWQFQPTQPWKADQYRLVVETTLEDRAGNSIARPFEVDVVRPIQRETTAKMISLPFMVRSEQ